MKPNAVKFGSVLKKIIKNWISILKKIASRSINIHGLGNRLKHLACFFVHPDELDKIFFLTSVKTPIDTLELLNSHLNDIKKLIYSVLDTENLIPLILQLSSLEDAIIRFLMKTHFGFGFLPEWWKRRIQLPNALDINVKTVRNIARKDSYPANKHEAQSRKKQVIEEWCLSW